MDEILDTGYSMLVILNESVQSEVNVVKDLANKDEILHFTLLRSE
jgi:hypothetical protein